MQINEIDASKNAPNLSSSSEVAVVVGGDAPQLERFAAEQLCDYLEKLFGIHTHPVSDIPMTADGLFLVGSPDTNAAVKRASDYQPFPRVSEQGLVLQYLQSEKAVAGSGSSGCTALLVGGGSPCATLWAVYELVERWGGTLSVAWRCVARTSSDSRPTLPSIDGG